MSNVVSLKRKQPDKRHWSDIPPDEWTDTQWAHAKIEVALFMQRDPRLGGAASKVGTVLLLDFFNFATGECNPSLETLEDALLCSRSTIQDALQALVAAGYFDREDRPGYRPNYRPTLRGGLTPREGAAMLRRCDETTGRNVEKQAKRRAQKGTRATVGGGDSHTPAVADGGSTPHTPGGGESNTPAGGSDLPTPGVAVSTPQGPEFSGPTPVLPILSPASSPNPLAALDAREGEGANGHHGDREARDGQRSDLAEPARVETRVLVDQVLDDISLIPLTSRSRWQGVVTLWVEQHGGIVVDVVRQAIADGAKRDDLQPRVTARLAALRGAADPRGAGEPDHDEAALKRKLADFEREFVRHWNRSAAEIAALLAELVAAKRAAGEVQPGRAAWAALRGAFYTTKQADAAGRATALAGLLVAPQIQPRQTTIAGEMSR